jgi:hypothetical protein
VGLRWIRETGSLTGRSTGGGGGTYFGFEAS